MSDKKEKLDRSINFRSTEKMYKDLIKYLQGTEKTISTVIRQATFEYLRLQEHIKKNGYGDNTPLN